MSDDRPAAFGQRGAYLLLSALVAAGTGLAGFELGRGRQAANASAGADRPAPTVPATFLQKPADDHRAGSITGVFYRHSGNTAAGGQVSLTRDDVLVGIAMADAGGRFSFPRVPPGHYELVGRSAWSAPGARHDEHSLLRVHVSAGTQADVKLVPTGAVWTNVDKSI